MRFSIVRGHFAGGCTLRLPRKQRSGEAPAAARVAGNHHLDSAVTHRWYLRGGYFSRLLAATIYRFDEERTRRNPAFCRCIRRRAQLPRLQGRDTDQPAWCDAGIVSVLAKDSSSRDDFTRAARYAGNFRRALAALDWLWYCRRRTSRVPHVFSVTIRDPTYVPPRMERGWRSCEHTC